jgi:uncharacterized membrane protein (GlpM family)
MRIELKPSALKETRWYEYLVRFAFGGLIAVVAGVVGHSFGLFLGGLFLAFPAILPASLTLVKKHDGRKRAADDAAGAVCGAIGLFGFAAVVWSGAQRFNLAAVLAVATVLWFALSYLSWRILDAIQRG